MCSLTVWGQEDDAAAAGVGGDGDRERGDRFDGGTRVVVAIAQVSRTGVGLSLCVEFVSRFLCIVADLRAGVVDNKRHLTTGECVAL